MAAPTDDHTAAVCRRTGSFLRRRVRRRADCTSVNMMPNNKKPPPVVLEFRDWSIEKNSTAPTPLFPPNEGPSPPPPTPGAVFGVRPPLLVSVPSGRQPFQAAMMTNNRINVEPLAPAPTPPMSPPAGVLFPPPPVGDTRVGGMVHFVHSGPAAAAAASSYFAAAAAAAGTGTRSKDGSCSCPHIPPPLVPPLVLLHHWRQQLQQNVADAALLEYQTLAEQQQEHGDGKAGSSGSKNRNRFNSSRLKRTNSKTRVYQQAPLPPPPST